MVEAQAGVLQQIEIQGERYDVQTEVVDPESAKVRTVIFCGGRAVAFQESRLGRAPDTGTDDDDLQRRLEKHHAAVINGFVKRTLGFESWEAGPKVAAAAATSVPEEVDAALPPLPEDPFLADSLDVRRLFGEVRRRIHDHQKTAQPDAAQPDLPDWFNELLSEHEPHEQSDSAAALDRAGSAFVWAAAQPTFARVRVDEQARFHRFARSIDDWRQAGRPAGQARQLLAEIKKFLRYIHEINLRAELVDYDRRLIAWALASFERRAASTAQLKPLRWLFGRDPEVDSMLACEDPPEAERWLTALQRIQADLHENR